MSLHDDVLVAGLMAAHHDECTCRRCVRLHELPDQVLDVEHCECRDRCARTEQHRLHHHHIDDFDELERAETELAWEEIS